MEQNNYTSGIKKTWRLLTHPRFQKIREWLNFGVLGLNSFILLYYRSEQGGGFQKVVLAGAVSYAVVLFLQSISYRHTPERRMQILKITKKVFRLIYTAVYLTSIMMNIIVASETSNHVLPMVYYGWIFIWTTLWGTNCLWIHKVTPILSRLCTRRKSEDDNKALLG